MTEPGTTGPVAKAGSFAVADDIGPAGPTLTGAAPVVVTPASQGSTAGHGPTGVPGISGPVRIQPSGDGATPTSEAADAPQTPVTAALSSLQEALGIYLPTRLAQANRASAAIRTLTANG